MLSQSIQPRSHASPSLSVEFMGLDEGVNEDVDEDAAPTLEPRPVDRSSIQARLEPSQAAQKSRRCMPLCHHSTASYRVSNQQSSKESSDFRRGGTTLDGSTADAIDGMGEDAAAAFAPSPPRPAKGASRVRSSGVHVSTSARVPTLEAPKSATSSATRGP